VGVNGAFIYIALTLENSLDYNMSPKSVIVSVVSFFFFFFLTIFVSLWKCSHFLQGKLELKYSISY
jgi:hypothetical protein